MGILNGKQEQMLNEALSEAFPTHQAFQSMLRYELDININNYVGPADDARTRAFKIIEHYEAHDTTLDLINGARASNPTAAKLLRFSQMVASSITTPSKSELEAMIGSEMETAAITTWRERIGAIEGQVCRIANPEFTGT